jgi:hypothetical protein
VSTLPGNGKARYNGPPNIKEGLPMPIRGKIKKGKVVLENPNGLPEGTEVEVRAVRKRRKPAKPAKASKSTKPKERPRSLAERLAPFIGIVKGLPPDASVNVDHYVYGVPKRK